MQSAADRYTAAMNRRRALVVDVLNETHNTCKAPFCIMQRHGFLGWLRDNCIQLNYYIVLFESSLLPVPVASVEGLYRKYAEDARHHPNPQVALDLHAAAKAVLRQFLIIASGPKWTAVWAFAGARLTSATRDVIRIVPPLVPSANLASS
jgi:hypothetical protein